MSPGAETNLLPVYLAINSTADYERLCALDVLGLVDTGTGDQGDVYNEFNTHSPEGWYKTALPWKGNHPPSLQIITRGVCTNWIRCCENCSGPICYPNTTQSSAYKMLVTLRVSNKPEH